MKTEFVDVNETRKNLRVEIPSDVVDAEIDRIARDYSRKARIPGFRPGQGAGARHQAALQGPDPPRRRARSHSARRRRRAARARRRAGRHARRPRRHDRGGPAADVHGVVRHACRRSSRATTPTISLRRPSSAVDGRGGRPARCERLRERAARFEPVEGRGVDHGDTVVVDLERRDAGRQGATRTTDVSVELGAKANPPGFDEQLLGLDAGREQDVHDPLSRPTTRSRSSPTPTCRYTVTVKGIKRRVLPELDDEFAKDLGRVRDARRAARAGARGPRARGAARAPSARCAPSS